MNVLLLCGLLLLSPLEATPSATLPPTETEEYLDAVDLSPWDDFFARLEGTEGWQRPSLLVRELAAGEGEAARLLSWLKRRGLNGLTGAAGICFVALVTGVLGALLETWFDGAVLPARRVLSIGLAAWLLLRLLPLIRRGLMCLRGVLTLADVTVPLMTGALLLLGSPQGASVMGTMGELLTQTCLRWMEGSLVPLTLSAGILRTADMMGDSVLTAISRLLFTVARWGVRLICLGYTIVAGSLGAGAAGMDSLLLRSGRAAAGSLPLVGSIVSDSLGTVAACLGLVKGALGRTGILLITAQVAGPVGALMIHGFGLRAAAALLTPLEQREMGSMLSALGEMLTILGALILAAGAMLCVAVGGASGCWGGGL